MRDRALPGALAASPVSAFAWRLVALQRRQGLAPGLRSEFREDRPQCADALRERVFVALNNVV
jgi:hypothetical protein